MSGSTVNIEEFEGKFWYVSASSICIDSNGIYYTNALFDPSVQQRVVDHNPMLVTVQKGKAICINELLFNRSPFRRLHVDRAHFRREIKHEHFSPTRQDPAGQYIAFDLALVNPEDKLTKHAMAVDLEIKYSFLARHLLQSPHYPRNIHLVLQELRIRLANARTPNDIQIGALRSKAAEWRGDADRKDAEANMIEETAKAERPQLIESGQALEDMFLEVAYPAAKENQIIDSLAL